MTEDVWKKWENMYRIFIYIYIHIMKIYKLTNSMSYQKFSPRTKKVGLKPVVPNRSVVP